MPELTDVKSLREEAQKEYEQEKQAEAKKQIKAKLKELDNAKKIVRNIEREIEDLQLKLTQ